MMRPRAEGEAGGDTPTPFPTPRWFRRTCVAAITELQVLQGHPESLKMSLPVMAQSVNKRANYPIFAWHKRVSVQFCKDRWRVILDAIVAKTNPPPKRRPC
jgi:hypothetical protein